LIREIQSRLNDHVNLFVEGINQAFTSNERPEIVAQRVNQSLSELLSLINKKTTQTDQLDFMELRQSEIIEKLNLLEARNVESLNEFERVQDESKKLRSDI